ncbi:MAG: alpha/beta hydrolase [Sphingomonadales bacterium]
MIKALKRIGLIVFLLIIGGLALGWTPNISHNELKARYATPPSAFLELPGGAVAHYRDRGPKDAPALILLHGSAASLYTWEAWAKELPNDLRVISVDFPGHGLTGATPQNEYWIKGLTDFLEEFIDTLGLEKVALAGNSMGGGISTSYALRRPEKVAALILIDADGLPEDLYEDIEGPVGFSIAHMPGLRWLATKITPRFLVKQGLADVSENPDVVTEEAVDLYWNLLRHPGNREAMIARFKAAETTPMNHEFEAIKAPTLVMWGTLDRLIPPANGEAMARRIPNAELIMYEGVGHLPQEEIPAKSAKDALTFLEKHWLSSTTP